METCDLGIPYPGLGLGLELGIRSRVRVRTRFRVRVPLNVGLNPGGDSNITRFHDNIPDPEVCGDLESYQLF